MINVYEFYQDALDRINKEENGYLKPDQFNRILKYASVKFQCDLIEGLQDVNKSDKHQHILDILMPFVVRAVLPVSTTGIVSKPQDYEHFAALRLRYDDAESCREVIRLNSLLCDEDDPTIDRRQVELQMEQLQQEDRYTDLPIFPHEKLAKRLTSAIPSKKPSQKKPVGEYAADGWKVYPSNTASALLIYYRRPAEAKLVMKEDISTGDVVYDNVASKDLEWSEKAKEDLLKTLINVFAIYVREGELFQMIEAPAKQS